MKKSTKRLSIFLLTDNVDFDNYIVDVSSCEDYEISDNLPFDGKIYIGEQKSDEPDWVDFLRSGTDETIDSIWNTSNRAVVIVSIANRNFALTFGYGRFLVKEEYFERNFGLKTALNGVDPNKLRSIDLINVLELGVQTRMQSARSSSRDIFGFDILNDLLKVVTGMPANPNLGKVITGRDQLSISPKINFPDLKNILEDVLVIYNNDNYKNNFDWIDNIKVLNSKSISDRLNKKIEEDFKNNRYDNMSLSPPEPIDWEKFECFSYTKKDEKRVELNVLDFVSTVSDNKDIDIDFLKNRKVVLHDIESDEKLKKWSIYECLNYESVIDGVRYILSSGTWYSIDTKYAQQVEDYVSSLPESNLVIIDANPSEKEGEYNERLVNKFPNYSLGDKKNIKCEFARTVIEPCDIFTDDKKIVHVKPGRRSSTLSHLFSQGRVSSEAFQRDKVFRKGFRRNLRKEGKVDYNLVPLDRFKPNEYEVVFAFIDDKTEPLSKTLPFFSLVNLMHSCEKIRTMGYFVSVKKIVRR